MKSKKISIYTISIIAALVLGTTGVYSLSTLEKDDEKKAIQIAKDFILNAPTFKFDGIPDSVNTGQVTVLESDPVQYLVEIKFESANAGYGDRTNQGVNTVITPHIAIVKVVNNNIIQAVIDGQWDEIEQVPLMPLINDQV